MRQGQTTGTRTPVQELPISQGGGGRRQGWRGEETRRLEAGQAGNEMEAAGRQGEWGRRKRAAAGAPRRTGFFRFPPRVFLSPSLASRGCVFLGRGRNYKIQYGGWGGNWRGFGRPPVLVAVAAPPPPSLSRAAIANAPSPGLPCPEPLEF